MPLFVSHRRLAGRRTLPKANAPWALDSGGFTELSMHGRWTVTPEAYVAAARRFDDQIGHLEWAAPQDWMCEPHILTRTGLTVAEHQRRTVDNYLQLRHLWGDTYPEYCVFMPVLQGWSRNDYLRCADLYAQAGVNLAEAPVVGLGSVCRRQAAAEIDWIVRSLSPIRLHGFGVKTTGLARFGHLLGSADSMAWSFDGRRTAPGCTPTHRNEANCLRFALAWHARIEEAIAGSGVQLDLFDNAA